MKKKLLLSVLAAGLVIPTSFASAAWQDDIAAKVKNTESDLTTAIAHWNTQPKQDRDLVLPLLNQRLLNVKLTNASASLEKVKKEMEQKEKARKISADQSYNYGKQKKVKETELAKINEKLNGANASTYKVAKFEETNLTYPEKAAELTKEIANLKNIIAVADANAKYYRQKVKELKAKSDELRNLIRELRAKGAVDVVTPAESGNQEKSESGNQTGKTTNKEANKPGNKVLPKTSAVK